MPVTASGLYTIHAAAILLETSTPDTSPGSLVAPVTDEARRATIQARLVREGLRDSDLRVLSKAAGLSLYRATRLGDLDPFEPISDRILTMLRSAPPMRARYSAGSSCCSIGMGTGSRLRTPAVRA